MAGFLGTCGVKTQTSVQATDTIGNTTTATLFGTSYTIPIGLMNAVGRRLDLEAWGVYGTDTTGASLTVALVYGSTTIATTGLKTLTYQGASNAGWFGKFSLATITTGTTGTVEAQGAVVFGTSTLAADWLFARNAAPVTVGASASVNLGLQVAWGTAGITNSITQRLLLVNQGGAI
jgi:hypothetical protein